VRPDRFSLFAERNRISQMAVYMVHASLLLIFAGGIIDALYGWRGFMMLTPGNAGSQIEVRNGTVKTLPFSIRCDGTGQETYTDGTPKRWWSKLAVVDDGRDVSRKEIVVNDPLVYHGVRFYQASWGRTGKIEKLVLNAVPAKVGSAQEITLAENQIVSLDADTQVQLAEFIPDYVVQDGHVYARSNDVVNPAVRLIVSSAKSNKSVNFWLPEIPGVAENQSSPYNFEPKDLKTGVFTGLEVSHEPGQWAVWAGVVLMAVGLTFVFYVVHVRFWVVPLQDTSGKLTLWVGGTANRNRDAFERTFKQLVEQIQKELKTGSAAGAETAAEAVPGSVAGR
jgi:cytochrome c biogenesis protein